MRTGVSLCSSEIVLVSVMTMTSCRCVRVMILFRCSGVVCVVEEDHEFQGAMGTLKMEVSALLADRKYEVKISDRSRNFLGSSLRRKLVISPSFLFWLC